MKRVYVAGPYSDNNVISILDNIRRGMRTSTEVMLAGYSPFCPWLDFHYQLMLRPGERLTVDDFYRYSLDWHEVSDGMLVLPNHEKSKGTLREIGLAKELNIPVFHSLEELQEGR